MQHYDTQLKMSSNMDIHSAIYYEDFVGQYYKYLYYINSAEVFEKKKNLSLYC